MSLNAHKEILRGNLVGAIATVNDDGSPWVTPVHIFSDDEAVYWFSDDSKCHSRNIARDPRVSLTLFSPDTRAGNKGVYICGKAEKLDSKATVAAKRLMVQKMGAIMKSLSDAPGYKLAIGEFDEQKSTGNCWYFYS